MNFVAFSARILHIDKTGIRLSSPTFNLQDSLGVFLPTFYIQKAGISWSIPSNLACIACEESVLRQE
jgi:hypothetical protein